MVCPFCAQIRQTAEGDDLPLPEGKGWEVDSKEEEPRGGTLWEKGAALPR